MRTLEHAAGRDAGGRFKSGCSGNPAGKKPGTVHAATALRAVLRDGEEAAAVRLLVDKALAGNMTALRFLNDRLYAKPRGRPIEFNVEDSDDVGQLVAAGQRAVTNGEMTTQEGLD